MSLKTLTQPNGDRKVVDALGTLADLIRRTGDEAAHEALVYLTKMVRQKRKPRPFDGYLKKLDGHLLEVEHFKTSYNPVVEDRVEGTIIYPKRRMNVAVAILKDGRAFVGESRQNYKDQDNHQTAYYAAMGRALKAATCARAVGDFLVPSGIVGVALRDYCRERLERSGWLPLPTSVTGHPAVTYGIQIQRSGT
jgi:hypothetical protein